MFDSAEIRIHPTGKAIARFGTKSQGQGHETTYAQIVAEELGISGAHVQVEEGDTDTAPYGLGHVRQPHDAGCRRGGCDGRAQDPRQGAQDRRVPARGAARMISSGSPGKFSVQGLARSRRRRFRRSRSPRTRIIRREWRRDSRR